LSYRRIINSVLNWRPKIELQQDTACSVLITGDQNFELQQDTETPILILNGEENVKLEKITVAYICKLTTPARNVVMVHVSEIW
jgi:hypothetical protein